MDISRLDQGLLTAYLIGALMLIAIFMLVYPSLRNRARSRK